MSHLAVVYNTEIKQFSITSFVYGEAIHIYADDYELCDSTGHLLLQVKGQIVSILHTDKVLGQAVLQKLEEIRKQDDAPVMGADSSPKKCVKCEVEFHCEGEVCESCSVSEIWG